MLMPDWLEYAQSSVLCTTLEVNKPAYQHIGAEHNSNTRHCDVCLAACAGDNSSAMLVRQFLGAIAPVIAREPIVFVEALANTCSVEESRDAVGSGRPIILLKPKVGVYLPKLLSVSLTQPFKRPSSSCLLPF